MTASLLIAAVGVTVTLAQVLGAAVRGFVDGMQHEELPRTQPMRAGYRAGKWVRDRRDQMVRDALSRNRQDPEA